ncbi:hypothetical protein LTR08_001348 [Meristemomyces frigidus]|nr:hypothetical protein LTR08_001348 [Meristemomyces frigidus]
MPTTQIVNWELVPGSEIVNGSDLASKGDHCGKEMFEQDGRQKLRFGMHLEHPAKLTMLLREYSAKRCIVTALPPPNVPETPSLIMTGQAEVLHVDFEPQRGFYEAVSAPVTEVATFAFDSSPPEDAYRNVEKAIEALKKEGVKDHGWSYGEHARDGDEGGCKGKSAVLVVGWESVEKHMEVRGSQAFNDNMRYLGNGANSVEVHHVQFKQSNRN